MNGPAIETSNTPPRNPPRVRAAVGISLTIHIAVIATSISVRPPAEFRHASVRSGAAAIELQASRPATPESASTRFEAVPDTRSSRTTPDAAESFATDDSFTVDDTPPEPNADPRDRRPRDRNATVSATTDAAPSPEPPTSRLSASQSHRGQRNTSSAALPEIRRPPHRPETRRMPVRPPRPDSAVVSVPVTSVPIPATSTPGASQDTPQPLASNRPPSYPSEAIAERVEGTTTLRATVGPEGEVTKLEIDRSSGSAVLDRAAMSAVALWRFEPQTQSVSDRGPRRVLIPIRFRLDD